MVNFFSSVCQAVVEHAIENIEGDRIFTRTSVFVFHSHHVLICMWSFYILQRVACRCLVRHCESGNNPNIKRVFANCHSFVHHMKECWILKSKIILIDTQVGVANFQDRQAYHWCLLECLLFHKWWYCNIIELRHSQKWLRNKGAIPAVTSSFPETSESAHATWILSPKVR